MKRNITFIILAVAVIIGGVYAANHFGSSAANTNSSQNQTNMDGLQIQDLVVGTGAEAKAGDTVTVNYIGTLDNGTKFDSSYDRNQPFTFILGANQVIPGWDEGVAGMKVGGKRRLVIPPALGYGSQGRPPVIPPNATLHFDVELLGVQSGS